MRNFKLSIVLLLFTALSFTTAHKYYVSITQIEYVKDKKTVQIITRIFIDDLENLLRSRYDKTITLQEKEDETVINTYLSKYLKSKIEIDINNQPVVLNFIGKEYDNDLVYCYLEIPNVENIKSFSITNKVLFDVFPEQKNVIRTNINSKNKSFILILENDKGLLNF
ncbi:DUF6702 family protein [Lacinutrix salivirga]